MNRRLNVVGIALVSMGLSACAHMDDYAFWRHSDKTKVAEQKPAAKPVRRVATRTQALPDFNAIEADGLFDIKIVQDKRLHNVSMTGYSDVIGHVQPIVTADTLHLHMDKAYTADQQSRIHVVIRTPNIHRIAYSGGATVHGDDIKTALLDVDMERAGDLRLNGKIGLRNIIADGNAKMHIKGVDSRQLNVNLAGGSVLDFEGVARVKQITASGGSWLRMQWLDSPELKITLKDKAKVTLAGKTELLRARVHNNATLDAKYLRAERAFVKTFDYALAEVNSVSSQNTLASGESNIYYYNDSEFHGDFMAHQGSVLDFQQMWLVDGKHRVPKIPNRDQG